MGLLIGISLSEILFTLSSGSDSERRGDGSNIGHTGCPEHSKHSPDDNVVHNCNPWALSEGKADEQDCVQSNSSSNCHEITKTFQHVVGEEEAQGTEDEV